jgi:hypothetical protein
MPSLKRHGPPIGLFRAPDVDAFGKVCQGCTRLKHISEFRRVNGRRKRTCKTCEATARSQGA